MAHSTAIRGVARALLPDALVGRLSATAAYRERRANLKRLPSATTEFDSAYAAYWQTGAVPADAEKKLHLATWSSAGIHARSRAIEYGAALDVSRFRGFPDELLKSLDPGAVARGVDEYGFYIAPFCLSSDVVADILGVLEAGPAQPRGDGLGDAQPGVPSIDAPTWWMQPRLSLRSGAVRRLLRERRLAEAAGSYLGVDPLIMSVVLWKSFASRSPDGRSAQQFHYDNDRSRFVKMFVYLTDVSMSNGPHTYVPGSHREKPKELLHGQRLSDRDVARFYPESGWKLITGPRGTLFFADTQGFHKGGHVAVGERAMFQINLASDRFGVPEPPIGTVADAPADLAAPVAQATRYFSQLFTPDRLEP
jgi:hypothetical protein